MSINGKWTAVLNYTGGSVSVFNLTKSGTLQPYAQLIQDSERAVLIKTNRQEKAHVHERRFSHLR